MNMYLIISQSCRECNSMAIRLISKEPIKQDIINVEEKCGGMHCIHTEIVNIESDGETKELEFYL